MPKALSLIFSNPAIRVPALAVFFYGTASAATLPYQSLIGIKDLKLDTTLYSVVMFTASLVTAVASIGMGVISDRISKRRPLVMLLALAGVLGFGLVYLIPSPLTFISSSLLLIPFCSTLNSLLYGTIRMATNAIDREAVVSVNSNVRAMFSASWILVPGILGAILSGAANTLPVYLAAAISSFVCFLLYFFFGNVDTKRTITESKPQRSAASDFMTALKELTHRRVLFRVSVIAVITGMLRLNGTVSPLIIEGSSASLRDVGIIAGAVALLEIPFMLMWGLVNKRLSEAKIIAIGATLYVAYMILLGFASQPWHFYALLALNACGAAAILSIPISYLQDLFSERPGLGSSLITVSSFLSNLVSSIVFAIGSVTVGYSGTAIFGAVAGFAGLAMLVLGDKNIRKQPKPSMADGQTAEEPSEGV